MNVLDIDLDFFLDGSVSHRSDDINNRPDEYGLVPWSDTAVSAFMENGLNVGMNYCGALVQSHHEVFFKWKKLIEQGGLTAPFKVVHVDAHSDLGLGGLSWTYLHSKFLSMDVRVAQTPIREMTVSISAAFWLLLLVADGCQRWTSS